MSVPLLVTLVLLWLAAVALVRWALVPGLARGPGGDPYKGLLWWMVRTYCRAWHRVIHTGADLLPPGDGHGGLIVVANHTGALDPLLIQARCRFFVRWMMAEEMMKPALHWVWRIEPIIPVARDGRDTAPLREAIRHVQGGGAVGIFPEGRITRPPREIRPFLPGVGLVIAKTRAPVLVVWVSGTPDTNRMDVALRRRSRARVAFLEIMRFDDQRDPEAICAALRDRIARASGWPLNDEVLPPGGAPSDVPSIAPSTPSATMPA